MAHTSLEKTGLSSTEVAERLVTYGPNQLVAQSKVSFWKIAAEEITEPMITFRHRHGTDPSRELNVNWASWISSPLKIHRETIDTIVRAKYDETEGH